MTWNMFLSLLLVFTKNKQTDKLLSAMEIYTDEFNEFIKKECKGECGKECNGECKKAENAIEEAAKDAANQVKDAAVNAATDAAVNAINNAASKATEAINK